METRLRSAFSSLMRARSPKPEKEDRTAGFKDRPSNRYWWFKATQASYVPPIFDFLTEEEWGFIDRWYAETDTHFAERGGTGECNVPVISALMGFVMGNNVSRIVQCGHYIGFSTLLIGFMLRRMGHKHGLFSVDLRQDITDYTQRWVSEAGLDDYVHLVVNDSANPELPAAAKDYLCGAPQILFIDSSHMYHHTVDELNLWYPNIQPGGFAFLHDVSHFASNFDPEHGGVRAAVQSWSATSDSQIIMINDFATKEHHGNRIVYKDACGLGIIQKPS